MFDEMIGQDDPWADGESTPRQLGEVLTELLRQYESAFPDVRITVVETPAAA